MFLLLLSLKFSALYNCQCYDILGYVSLFGLIITTQLIIFKRAFKTLFCIHCIEGSFCQKFCKSVVLYGFFALILGVVMALSLVAFLSLIDIYFFIFIFIDMLFFYFLYTRWNRSPNTQLKADASIFASHLVINVINSLVLIAFLVGFELFTLMEVHFSPDIFAHINNTIMHHCKLFQDILRTKAFMMETIYATRSIESIGEIIFAFLYVSTLSIIPMSAITMLFKFAIRIGRWDDMP